MIVVHFCVFCVGPEDVTRVDVPRPIDVFGYLGKDFFPFLITIRAARTVLITTLLPSRRDRCNHSCDLIWPLQTLLCAIIG
jgi:hypothetical protein